MVIAPMTAADLADVVGAEEETPAWSAAQFAEELHQPRGWQLVARRAESRDFAGSICCRSVAGEAEIVKFAVVRVMRRLGVGNALLAAALRRMATEGVASCFLEVRASNDAARRLYEKHGFQQIATRARYYRAPEEDALLYRLDLL